MGWKTLAVIAQFVIIEGPGDGLFVYDGTPAAGNLIASIASQSGTDKFGNPYQQGITSYDNSVRQFLQALGAELFFTSVRAGSEITAPAQISLGDTLLASGQPALFLVSPETSAAAAVTASLLGASADGSKPAQMLIAAALVPLTHALLEIQGSAAIGTGNGKIIEFLAPAGVAAADTANLAAILGAGNTPWLLPGTFALNCSDPALTALGPHQWICGSGDLNTTINAHGSGDLFYWSAPSPNSDGSTTGGGFIGGATIDMSACTGAAVGIHAGDINAMRFDCRVQHATRTGGSWGFLFDNANTFTERMHLNIRAKDCGFAGSDGGHVGFQVSGAVTSTASFARIRGRIEVTQGSNQQDGLVVQAGAHLYDCELELAGNFQGNALNATTAAAIRITGTVPAGHPGAGTHSRISNGRLDTGVECSSAANAPTTIIQGSSSNSIDSCYGNMNFNSNFTTAGLAGAGFKYDGQIQGDSTLGTRRYYGTSSPQAITGNGQTISSIVPSAKIVVTCAANFTGIILSAGDADGQLIYLVNTGTGSLSWAAAGSNVAGGGTVQPSSMVPLIWDAGTALWFAR